MNHKCGDLLPISGIAGHCLTGVLKNLQSGPLFASAEVNSWRKVQILSSSALYRNVVLLACNVLDISFVFLNCVVVADAAYW